MFSALQRLIISIFVKQKHELRCHNSWGGSANSKITITIKFLMTPKYKNNLQKLTEDTYWLGVPGA